MNGIFFALLGASIATALAGVGSARGVGSAAQAAMGVLSGVLGGTAPTIGQGLAYFAASLAIGIGGMISGFAQGKAAVSGIALSAKDDSNFSKAMVSVTLVEIYALLSFIVSLLVVITVPNLNI